VAVVHRFAGNIDYLKAADFFQFSDLKLEREASKIVTVCHGDAWSNNMMFEESEDSATLIDFQMITLGHPARDLWYLLAINTDKVKLNTQ
jgi:aminoglycoside phosphotransferase (APT) family kinase protein